MATHPPAWFRFTSCLPKANFCRIDLRAQVTDDLPPGALTFPDPAALRRDVTVPDFDEQAMPNFLLFLRDGRASLAKLALAAGGDALKSADRVLLWPNWDDLRAREAQLGDAYRTALSNQGVRYRAGDASPAD